MTNKEIIDGLYKGDGRAIKAAIEALEQEPCDAISRDAVCKWYCNMTCGMDFCTEPCLEKKQLWEMPSVQPKQTEYEDAISREDALKALDYDIKLFEFKSGVSKHMNEIANLLNTIYEIQSDNIKALPPVQPKIKVGHWEYLRCDMYECSECQNTYTDLTDKRYGMNYCPNCGAKMVEPQESEDKK